MTDAPIALIIFNRPEMTRSLVDCLRDNRPSRLFVIADGARDDRCGEADKVAQTRDVIGEIDWPCEISQLYSDKNLGCGQRIRSGITEAFNEVDKLIVLEDDCRPNQTFFRFTQELLQRFESDSTIMAISGTCFHDQVPKDQSYYFSRYAHCWGWATWRRAWRLYDTVDCDWDALSTSIRYAELFETKHQMAFWTQLLDRIAQGKLDTWDVQWMLACWLNKGLTIAPTQNLVSNVGFTECATHTNDDSPHASLPTFEMGELRHPQVVQRAIHADAVSEKLLFSGTWKNPGIFKSTVDVLRRRYGNCRNIQPGRKVA